MIRFIAILISATVIGMRSIIRFPARSFLTVLGVVIGVITVLLIVGLGDGMQNMITSSMEKFGTNMLSISAVPPQRQGHHGGMRNVKPFENSLIKQLEQSLPNVEKIDYILSANELVSAGGKNSSYNIMGFYPELPDRLGGEYQVGRNFTKMENDANSRVVLIGDKVMKEIFGRSGAAIDQNLRIKGIHFKVIGIFKPKCSFGIMGDSDYLVLMPNKTMQRYIRGGRVADEIHVWFKEGTDLKSMAEYLKIVIRLARKVSDPLLDDFMVVAPTQILDMMKGFINGTIAIFGVIALVSLIVGSIGVMNTMFVSVSERTPEIGLRKSLGAPPGAIQLQFLIESSTLTLSGGILGAILAVILGVVVGSALEKSVGGEWEVRLTLVNLALACGISLLVGLAAGLWPAMKAAKLDPIIAMRRD